MSIGRQKILILLFLLFLFSANYALADNTGNCATGSFAWSEKAGFISFNGAGASSTYGVTVTATGLAGYAWGAQTGWIHMSGTYTGGGAYAVANDGTGKLSDNAWGEKAGFISFAAGGSNYSNDSAANYGVSIDGSGNFQGYAWGAQTGWIHMSGSYTTTGTYGVTTTWTADSTPPTTTATAGAYTFGTWTSGLSVSVTLTCDDGSGVGCDSTNYPKYCVDTANTCNPVSAGTHYTASVSISTEGVSYIRYYSADTVPNTETVKSSTIKIDKTGPVANAGADQTKSAQFTQTGSATDADTSVASYQWSKVSGTGTITFGSATLAETTISASANDTYVIRLTATDTLGNTGTDDFTLVWSVDSAPPRVVGVGGGSREEPQPASTQTTQAPTNIIDQIGQQLDNIAKNIANVFGPQSAQQPAINYPPIEESVPKEPQMIFQGGNIIFVKEFEKISILPLPQSIKNLALKFPSFASTLEKVGISKPADVEKLKVAFLTFPSLSEVAGVPASLAFSKFTEEQKQKIPSNITFAKTGADNIDFNIKVSISDINKPVQSIATVQGKPLYLTVKPDNPASSVKGYVIFKSANSRAAFLDYAGKLSAGLSASLLDATNIIKKLDPANELPEVTAQKDIVLSEFDYANNGGIWTAEIDTPAVDGKYEVRTVIKYKEPTADNKLTESLSMILVVDPEGYIYEKTAGNKEIRINNAKVSIWWLNPSTPFDSAQGRGSGQVPKYQLWPAKDFQQENPQITDITGKYSFLVPVGTYYITAEAPDYLAYKGSPFEVQEGAGIHQNIELKVKNWLLKMLTIERIMLGIVIIILIAIFAVILAKKRKI